MRAFAFVIPVFLAKEGSDEDVRRARLMAADSGDVVFHRGI